MCIWRGFGIFCWVPDYILHPHHNWLLDVCEPEPVPQKHPFWTHHKVVLTPHIASMTQPETAVDAVLDNICRHRKGLMLIGLVDRARGY